MQTMTVRMVNGEQGIVLQLTLTSMNGLNCHSPFNRSGALTVYSIEMRLQM